MKILENKSELSKTLGFKIFLIFMLVWSLMIASSFIRGIIYDRQSYQRSATSSIIEPIGGDFVLDMTAVVIPYTYYANIDNKRVAKKDYALIMPNKYEVNANTVSNILSRGIFKTPVYTADIEITATFLPFEHPKLDYTAEFLFNEAIVFISTFNKQNYLALPVLSINDIALKESKVTNPFLASSINAFNFALTNNDIRKGFEINAKLQIQGGEDISILPMAGDNEITLTGDWADPSFTGAWLPTQRSVNKEGFAATWKIPSFNTSFESTMYMDNTIKFGNLTRIRTSFLLLNDTYQKSVRSIKYSMLFICVPFFALFLCEMLSKRKIHVLQYALIGLANIIFYLLLLSISEHTNFNISYIISSFMVISITALYVAALTKMKKLGIAIALVEVLIYTFLFGILQLTDYALLVGSLGMFVALAVAMYFTRDISAFLEEENTTNKDNDSFEFK